MSTATATATARYGLPRLAQLTTGPDLGDLSLHDLAAAHNNPAHEFNRVIACVCSRCKAPLEAPQLTAAIGVACDDCRAKALAADAMDKHRTNWEAICPLLYRDTDKNHPGFLRAQYQGLINYTGTESLLFYGPTRRGKTRLAMMLLKRCMVRQNLHVGVMWAERLKSVKNTREVFEMVEKWGKPDVLLLDDALLSGAQDERVTDFLKDLLDFRMRAKRCNIITSQIGSRAYKDQANKFDNITKADAARVDALLERVGETHRLINCDEAPPQQGESSF
jgi:hypothetical protein